MFPSNYHQFKHSLENNDYLFHEDFESLHFVNEHYYTEKEKKFIKEKMSNGEDFIIKKAYKNNIIYYKSIKNIANVNNAAYIVIYSNSEYLKLLEKSYMTIYFALALIYTIFLFLLFNKYKSFQQIKDQKEVFNQQAKLAAIGELINNIAHQWRQPLSVISTSASGIKLQSDYGVLDNETFSQAMDLIVDKTNKLSKTIENFRNYTQTEKSKEPFKLKDIFDYGISLFEYDISLKHIYIVKSIVEVDLITYKEDLKQVITTLLKNAIDFSDNYGVILVHTKVKKNKITITIHDSAGGIDKDFLPKIFEPYVTSQHQTEGKGLALYAAYELVTNNLNGTLSVENDIFQYKFKNYKGAKFTITLDKEI